MPRLINNIMDKNLKNYLECGNNGTTSTCYHSNDYCNFVYSNKISLLKFIVFWYKVVLFVAHNDNNEPNETTEA